MSFWAVISVLLLVALLIPILTVLADAPLFRRPAPAAGAPERPPPPPSDTMQQLARRVSALEDELDDLGRAVRDLRDETELLRTLLEGRERPER